MSSSSLSSKSLPTYSLVIWVSPLSPRLRVIKHKSKDCFVSVFCCVFPTLIREYEMPTWPGGKRARGTQQEPNYTTSIVSKARSRFETPVTQPRWHTQPRRQGNRAYSIHSCTQGQCFSFKTEVVCLFIQHVNILQFYFVDYLVWVKEALCIKYQIKN